MNLVPFNVRLNEYERPPQALGPSKVTTFLNSQGLTICFSPSALHVTHTASVPHHMDSLKETAFLEILAIVQGGAEMKGGQLLTIFSKQLNGELFFEHSLVPITGNSLLYPVPASLYTLIFLSSQLSLPDCLFFFL